MESLLTASDASKILDVTASTVRQLSDRGVLRLAVRTPKGIRLFRRRDVERLALQRAAQGSGARAVQSANRRDNKAKTVAATADGQRPLILKGIGR